MSIAAAPTPTHQPDPVATVRLRGRVHHFGAAATFEALVLSDGRFWWRIEGPLPEEVRFDGRDLLVRNYNGAEAPVVGRDGALMRMTAALLGAPWHGVSDRAGAGPHPIDGTSVAATFASGAGAARVIEVPSLGGLARLTGEGRESIGGLTVHRSVVNQVAGQVQSRFTVEEAVPIDTPSLPAWVEDAGPVVVRFRGRSLKPLDLKHTPTGQLLVRVAWGGEPGWWVLDTGASDATVDAAVARRRGLTAVGSSVLTSMYGQTTAPVYRVGELDFGPVRLDRLAVTEMDLAPLSEATGETLVGIIGFDLLTRVVVEFTAGQAQVLMGPPEAAPRDVAWRPLLLLDRHPVVEGVVEGLAGRFRLDTGAGPGLMLNQWVAEETELLRGRASEPITGAPFEGRVATIGHLELAGHRVTDVPTLFVTGGDGPIAAVLNDRDLVGNVGSEVLRRFRVVLDYGGRRVALVGPA